MSIARGSGPVRGALEFVQDVGRDDLTLGEFALALEFPGGAIPRDTRGLGSGFGDAKVFRGQGELSGGGRIRQADQDFPGGDAVALAIDKFDDSTADFRGQARASSSRDRTGLAVGEGGFDAADLGRGDAHRDGVRSQYRETKHDRERQGKKEQNRYPSAHR